ncbi:hypothetical protein TIFTF001_018329 [Ficus carica]|uniref:Uncharacterized protein n=1 Tax=Ficus carica TaxID=3494 RepID=A0AA88A9J2_FICCA|nr:hypothetical protein TIFTF001_018329 [Ficus carica]
MSSSEIKVEKILSDVRADNVKVFPGNKHCDWADFMVIATGRSTWHVKQKQKGAKRLVLPSVEGEEGGKWIVIDSGKVVIHALDEKAREYYNLENLWTTDTSEKEPTQDWHGSSASPFDACAVALIHFWNVNKGKKGGMLPLCRGFISGIAADLEKAMVKIRRKNNSKKPAQKSA